MKSHRLKIAVLLARGRELAAYGALPAFASVRRRTDRRQGVGRRRPPAMVGWIIPANNGGSAITRLHRHADSGVRRLHRSHGESARPRAARPSPVSPTARPTRSPCTPPTSTATRWSRALPPRSRRRTTRRGCNFNSFPAVPSGSSELSVNCILTTAVGAAGNDYRIEDYPQASWNQGAGRTITTTAATAKTSATITASAGHFSAQDVNDTVTGTGVPEEHVHQVGHLGDRRDARRRHRRRGHPEWREAHRQQLRRSYAHRRDLPGDDRGRRRRTASTSRRSPARRA